MTYLPGLWKFTGSPASGVIGHTNEPKQKKQIVMKKELKGAKPLTPSATLLRKLAEDVVQAQAPQLPENLDVMSHDEVRQILHELRVHQIELDMQNDELRRSQTELDVARKRYFDLYDLAPVGYVTVSEKGLVLEANLTAATILGEIRGKLVRQRLSRFILPEDQDTYYLHHKQLIESGEPQKYELRMLKKDSTAFWAHLDATAAQDVQGEPVCLIAISDIYIPSQTLQSQGTVRRD